jgi:integral membrane sensor domain MASE1
MITLTSLLAIGAGAKSFASSILDTWIGRVVSLSVVALVALFVYGHYEQHKGAIAERARQEQTDVKVANRAAAAVSNSAARRVLDPSTDTSN